MSFSIQSVFKCIAEQTRHKSLKSHVTENSQNISTHLLTVIIICVILHTEQRKRNGKTGNGRKDERKRFPGKEVPRPCSGRKNNRIQRKAHLSETGKNGNRQR